MILSPTELYETKLYPMVTLQRSFEYTLIALIPRYSPVRIRSNWKGLNIILMIIHIPLNRAPKNDKKMKKTSSQTCKCGSIMKSNPKNFNISYSAMSVEYTDYISADR